MIKKFILITLISVILILFIFQITNPPQQDNNVTIKNKYSALKPTDLSPATTIKNSNIKKTDSKNHQEIEEIKEIVKKFQEFIKNRNVDGIMSFYTPPKTNEEIKSYNNLIGKNPDIGIPRLFNNTVSNFIVSNWKIEKIKENKDKYLVLIKETRKKWCNADPCAGTYSFEEETFSVLKIIKFNSRWMIEKYYFKNAEDDHLSNEKEGSKYEALYF